MFRKFLIPLLTGVFLAASAFAPATMTSLFDSAQAATTVKGSRSNGSFKVTAVDGKAGTFTGITKGKEVTFISPKGKPLPTVGKIYDITYIQNPGSGPLQAVTTNSSKSNLDSKY